MPWFSVRCLSECVLDDAPALYEDCILLIQAEDDVHARRKGDAAARKSSHQYANSFGETVRWEFREVLDVKQLFDAEIRDGSEVYYSFLSHADLENVRTALETPLD
jgi:Domain of unknown function (DUF4288)